MVRALTFKLALALTVAFSACTAFALDPAKPLADLIHETWSVDSGLPQGTIRAMVQTRDGYIWFGTHEGLARFDGHAFKVFNEASTPLLRGNSITALLESREGTLYIGLRDGGVVRFNEDVFTAVNIGAESAPTSILALAEDATGAIWVGTTGQGAIRLSAQTPRAFRRKDGLAHDTVNTIKTTASGDVWLGTFAGLSLVRGDRVVANPAGNKLDKAYIASIAEDSDKRLWIATFGEGLYRWSKDELRHFDKRDGLVGDTFNRVLQDKQGSIWIGGLEGLQRLVANRFESYGSADGLTNNFVREIMQDREGSLWVGTDRGIDRFRDGRVTMWGSRSGLAEEFARTIVEDRTGNIWIGTADGLFRFMPNTGAKVEPRYRVTRYGREQGFANAAILSLDVGADGAIWVGTNAGGLYRLRPQTNYQTENIGAKMQLGAASVRAVLGAHDESVWVATNIGLFRWRGNAPVLQLREANGLPSDQIIALHEDGGKTLWVGTRNGIARVDDGVIVPNPPGYAFDGSVFSFSNDATGVLWLATSKGLAMIQGAALRQFKQTEGVPERTLFNVLDDRQGNLWMCSNQGIVRVPKAALREIAAGSRPAAVAELLGRPDGMATVQCNGGSGPSASLTRDGRLMFATARGVAMIDAARAKQEVQSPPPVHLSSVDINGRSVPFAKGITLPPGEHRIEIRYVGLNFADPERVRYRYRLQGFDNRWIDAESDRLAVYTNLPAGRYQFQVAASNQSGVWGETQDAAGFVVKAHFYTTLWFRAALAAFLLAAAAIAYRWRVTSFKKRAVVLRAQVDERTRDLAEQTRKLELANDEKAKLLVKVEAQARNFEVLAKEDALTGLANRRELDRFLAMEVERARRNDRPLCVVMADIDFFKDVNDRFSHAIGDEVLRVIAKMFMKSCRSIDVAARIGGEEFVLVLPETKMAPAEMFCERLRDAVEHHDWRQLHAELRVTMSFGISAADRDATPESLLNTADQRLYAAKRAGRNRVMV